MTDEPRNHRVLDMKTGKRVSPDLPTIDRYGASLFRACDAGESAGGGTDLRRCQRRATVWLIYLVKDGDGFAGADTAFCGDHREEGMAALAEAALRGEILPMMQMQESPDGFPRPQ